MPIEKLRAAAKHIGRRALFILREFPNAIVFYTAGLHMGWGLIFMLLDELPLPFAGIQFYAENGGKPFWGPAFLVVGMLAVASTIARDRDRKFLLIAPSLLVVFLGAFGIIQLLVTAATPRLWVGSGYVLPHALFYGLAIALNYGLPHEQYLKTLQRYGNNH